MNGNHESIDTGSENGIRNPRVESGPEPRYAGGHRPRQPRGKAYKSQVLASLLSLMPGLGQVYVGYYQRGFIHAIVVVLLITMLSSGMGALDPLFGVFLAFFWMYNVIDAGRRAHFYNLALDGSEEISLPADFSAPSSGSIGGGLTLIGLGILLFLYTRFDIDMDWVAEYWPLLLVGFGVYLVLKRMRSGSAE